MFSKELEIIDELNCLEAGLSAASVRVLLAFFIVAPVLEFNFSLEYLLKYLEKFLSDLLYL
jgi:hypothetical protein